jgi:hypothetical protein
LCFLSVFSSGLEFLLLHLVKSENILSDLSILHHELTQIGVWEGEHHNDHVYHDPEVQERKGIKGFEVETDDVDGAPNEDTKVK